MELQSTVQCFFWGDVTKIYSPEMEAATDQSKDTTEV